MGAIEFVSPLGAGASQHLDVDHDDDALRFHSIDNILGPSSALGFATRELEEHLILASEAEPTTFKGAL